MSKTGQLIQSVLLAAVLGFSVPATAEDSEAMFSVQMMTLETAQKLAQATLEDCRAGGYQVAVAVVDRFGNAQVVLRDRFAGAHTVETAKRKAYTAVSFRTDTLALAEVSEAGQISSGIRQIPGVLMLGGGVTVEAAGALVGGVGVSGAPSPDLDHACAEIGIEAITDDLEF